MADTLVDDVILNILPKLDKTALQNIKRAMNNQLKEMGENGGKIIQKSFFKKFEEGFSSIRKNWLAMVGAGAALTAGIKSQDDKVITNLKEQIAYADTLGTTASQIGLNTQDFAKLYTLIRSGDVESGVAIKAMQEFAKRLGEYKATGAKAEVFGAIKDPDNVGKAFLEAIALIGQEKDKGKKAYLIDQLLSGEAVEQMAEFFTQDISTLMKKASGKDYKALGNAIDTLGNQDTKLKEQRLQLEQKNLIGTALRTGKSGAELIGKREEFELNQLMRDTSPDKMEGTRKFSEGLSVMAEAMVNGASDLFTFKKAIKETTEAVKTLKNVTNTANENVATTYPAR